MVENNQPTKRQWWELEVDLRFPGAIRKLRVDGYDITIEVVREKMKMELMIYVNGSFKGAWVTKDCEERRRFLRPVTKHLYSAKQRKGVSKRMIKEYGLDATYTYYLPYWSSFRSLKRHLINNNDVIEVV